MEFEKILRLKLRFATPQGAVTAEDLWDLPLTSTRADRANLNNIAKGIARQLRAEGEEEFVNLTPRAATEGLQLSLDYVKHVIQTKQAENEAVANATAKREQKARILELIASKKDEELKGKSLEELNDMVNAL